MADNQKISDMLEHLLNNEQEKAEELFHEYVVAKSREIYEGLIESELSEEDKDEDDEEVDESSEDDSEDAVEENFAEAGDETDDLIGDIEADDDMGSDDDEEGDDMGSDDEEGSDEPASKDDIQDLASAIDELQAAFDQFVAGDEGDDMGDDDMGGDDMGGDDMGMKDEFNMGGMDQVEDLETVREYVEKVAPAKMGDNGVNAKSIVAGKNDMGGTTANIVKGGTEAGVEANKGHLKGSSLFKGKPSEDNAGNINVPGGKAGNAFSKKEPGHGAEKAGAKESGVSATSIIRGSR